ncbi:MAG TPA: hypothetical protein ENN64_00980 [bacterium]|nr:hypothetical protein [bacterium]
MKNYFIGVFLDKNTSEKIDGVLLELRRIFQYQNIPVRWVNKEKFHVTISYLGRDINFMKKLSFGKKFIKTDFKEFEVELGSVTLGINKLYRELLHFKILNGGEELRKLSEKYNRIYNIKNVKPISPHFTIGRVQKDIVDEEFRNLTEDISVFNNNYTDNVELKFGVKKIAFIESDLENYKIIKEISSS